MTFSIILKAVFRDYGVSEESLAKKLDTSVDVIHAWEQDKAVPTTHQCEDFSALFAIPLPVIQDSLNPKKE